MGIEKEDAVFSIFYSLTFCYKLLIGVKW